MNDSLPQAADSEIARQLRSIVGAKAVLEAEPMSAHTTFRIGGPTDYLVLPQSTTQIQALVRFCREHGIEWRVMGAGSDLLVSDKGLRGVTIKLTDNFSAIEVSDDRNLVEGGVLGPNERYVRVAAGASNAQVAEVACAAGLAGFEFASGIPGTIGGAAIMNAGAYGGEFKQVACQLTCLTAEGDMVAITPQQAAWGYRQSMMDRKHMVVLEAVLKLTCDDAAAIRERMDDLAQRRSEKQPLELPSAGSTFKRPEGYFAGKLIQDAGLQGVRVGDAQVSTKHAGFVVNVGAATANDVRELISLVQERVLSDSGVTLEPEVRMWGF